MKALLSVSDKKGIDLFASGLLELGFDILATRGTAEYLEKHGIAAHTLSHLLGMEESRELKTLHPQLYRWIFSGEIGVVAVVPYNFKSSPAVDSIDIGGISLLRAAAKNYKNVFAVFDPRDYGRVLEGIRQNSLEIRKELACKVFEFVSAYDASIAEWLKNEAP